MAAGSTSFGPPLFAVARDATGSYTVVLLGSTLLPLRVLVAGPVVTPPDGGAPDHASATA